jgi:F-type H+-transporting ATPase subunit O
MFSSLARNSSQAVRKAVRTMATDHKPKIQIYGTAARYANATYVAASNSGCLDKVEGELAGLSKAAEESPAFAGFLDNPLISRDDKAAQIHGILSEKRLSSVTTNLCATMAGNARLSELPKVADIYSKLMKAKRGEVDAVITSADALTARETNAIAAAIKETSSGANEVVISSKVDPSIIGGIQIQIGDQFLDLSIKSKIEEVSRTSI